MCHFEFFSHLAEEERSGRFTFRLMAENGFAPHLGNFADKSYLEEHFKLRQIRNVCTLYAGAFVFDSMLHMLSYQI